MVRSAGAVTASSIPGTAGGADGIDARKLTSLADVPGVVDYAPFVYLVAETGARPVVVAGTDYARVRSMSPWWKVDGRWPIGPREGLLGIDAARALGVRPGETLELKYGNRTLSARIRGVLETGGPEDAQVLVPLASAQRLVGRPDEVGFVQVSAAVQDRSADEVAGAIEARLPGVEATPLRQFTGAEERVLTRIQRLIALVSALVLAVAGLTVASTMVTRVLERREEVGLMKALGAPSRRVAGLFLAEAAGIGLAGGFLGHLGGLGFAGFIGRTVFESALEPSPTALPIAVSVAAVAAILASLWPVHRALAVDPAIALRGE
ncbi:MAG: FtsX-like permease family protein [Gammaproteobacteria bacterium]|nr:FtsX-like permease family protein [Gemmatimonadota bacterium]NIR37680.1 FtsX-like permease family protein [Actinomycetota bacterium]NIU75527.1 FtsX-like permease family protein [Gammaproteobacteria bacterium]NIY09505.1 FtsX-like permease family protein [Gemmatimonadota bacterium]